MQAIFVSPHLDDVVFSIGGMACADGGHASKAVVVTVFAGPPVADLPMRSLHRDMAQSDSVSWSELHALWQQRVAEDQAAMSILGCDLVHLPFPEAGFRPNTHNWRQVWGSPSSELDGLATAIEAALLAVCQRHGNLPIYAPIAVGWHVDHLITFRCAESLRRAGLDVRYYEDFPYAVRSGHIDKRLRELDFPMRRQTIDVTPHRQRRIAAATCYRSQLPGMFGDPAWVGPVLTAWGRPASQNADHFEERYWQP